MEYSTHWAYTYIDFEDNREYLEYPLVIYTKFFNYLARVKDDKYLCFIAKKGTSTDGASIPKLAQRLIGICPRDKEIRLPAIWHDNLYRDWQVELYEYEKVTWIIWKNLWTYKISQQEADGFIRSKMKDIGASFKDRNIVFIWLCIWWYKARNNYRELDT